MKFSQIKKQIAAANELIGQKIYDCRFDQFYTVASRDKHFFELQYEKRGTKKEAVSFVQYHIEMGQHILKAN